MEHKKTNILFILTDDQGAWAMGCAGNIDTDVLKENGKVTFSNQYITNVITDKALSYLEEFR